MVSYFDSLLGHLLKVLDDGGLSDNAYVFVIAHARCWANAALGWVVGTSRWKRSQ
jgi:arylsulfatase A-like enzyme